MADTAFMTMYRNEYVAGFEARSSLLRDTVTTEAQIKGQTAIFLVADSGSAVAATRGVNGLIPARADNNTQNTCTLTEWHDLVRKTGFNIFASQADQRAIMQQSSMGVINRKIDDQIITELNTGTVAIGAASAIPNVSSVMNAIVKLSNASVPWDSNVTALVQPSYLAYLMQAPEFASADYTPVRAFAGEDGNWRDTPGAYRWMNMLFISHPNLPGKGTTSEKNFFYHKSAIGQAMDVRGMTAVAEYNSEHDYSFARTSVFAGAKLLQNAGIVVGTYDGSVYA